MITKRVSMCNWQIKLSSKSVRRQQSRSITIKNYFYQNCHQVRMSQLGITQGTASWCCKGMPFSSSNCFFFIICCISELHLRPHFYFCDATVNIKFSFNFIPFVSCKDQVESAHIVISKFRFQVSVTSRRVSMRYEDEYPMEFSSDIPGHYSMNPRFPGLCAVLPPT